MENTIILAQVQKIDREANEVEEKSTLKALFKTLVKDGVHVDNGAINGRK